MSTSYDDMQDILAGILDDKPPDTKEIKPSEVTERVEAALDAGMIDMATAIEQVVEHHSETVVQPLVEAAEAEVERLKNEEGWEQGDFASALTDLLKEGAEEAGVPLSPPPGVELELPDGSRVDLGVTLPGVDIEDPKTGQSDDSDPVPVQRVAKSQVHIPTFTTDEIADAIDIRNFGTLVTLQTRRWHAKVKDRQGSRDVAAANNADASAFDTHKRLLAGADEKLKRIHKAIDDARAKHYRMTLPWSTVTHEDTNKRTGARLLPNTLFMEYTTAMAHALQEMRTAINDFVPAYPTLIQLAQQKLGNRFDATEYPNSSAIAHYFDLSFDFMPIPLGGDFQGLADAQVQRLADTLGRKTRQMLENAMQDAWLRLHDTVAHAAERLANPDATFHYTMVERLKEQSDLLKHLNVTNDQRIEDVRKYVEKNLTMYDVKDIRKDENLRKQMAKAAAEALAAMEAA